MTVLAYFEALPFFLSGGRILPSTFCPHFSSFPPWQTSLEPVIFLLILSLERGGSAFSRELLLLHFPSLRKPRYLWLYLTQLGYEQTFFQTISPYPLHRLLGVTFGQTLMLGGT